MTNLVLPIALFVIVGIGQIVSAFGMLQGHLSNHWFPAIMLTGMLLNIAIIAFTAANRVNKFRA